MTRLVTRYRLIKRRTFQQRQMVRRFIPNLLCGRAHARLFRGIERFCLFVGYPRSGHSIVGALLEAHPHTAIAMEANVMAMVRLGYRREQIFQAILNNVDWFTHTCNGIWTGYDYRVPGQFQGRFKRLTVIGDKRGERTSAYISRRPNLIETLRRRVGCEVRVIHVVRNPFDMVATATLREHAETREPIERIVAYKVNHLRWLLATNERLIRRYGDSVLTVYHEHFTHDPARELIRILDHLGLSATPGYLEACTRIVYRNPRRSRDRITWNRDVRGNIEALISETSFLQGYSFDR